MTGFKAGNRVQKLPHTGLQSCARRRHLENSKGTVCLNKQRVHCSEACAALWFYGYRASKLQFTLENQLYGKYNQQLRRLGKEESVPHRKAKVRLLSLDSVLSITTDSILLLCADSEGARSRNDGCGVALHEVI